MILEQEVVNKIVEDYYKKSYNMLVKFGVCRINYASTVPCIINNTSNNVNIKREILNKSFDSLTEKQIANIIKEKYPDTKYINIDELKSIFNQAGYKNTHFICVSKNNELVYSAVVNLNYSYDKKTNESVR